MGSTSPHPAPTPYSIRLKSGLLQSIVSLLKVGQWEQHEEEQEEEEEEKKKKKRKNKKKIKERKKK